MTRYPAQLFDEASVGTHHGTQQKNVYQNGQPERAILILRQAVEAVPDYAPFHVQFGDYCRKEGITFLARQEYQRALMLEPGNKEAQERLRQMELGD